MAKLIRVWDGTTWQNVGAASAVGSTGPTGATGPSGPAGPTGATGANGTSPETLLSTTTLSGASTTISGINQSYAHLKVVVTGTTNDTAAGYNLMKPNNLSPICNYTNVIVGNPDFNGQVYEPTYAILDLRLNSRRTVENANADNYYELIIKNYSSSTISKLFEGVAGYKPVSFPYMAEKKIGTFNTTTAFTSLVFSNTAGNHTGGTVKIYGIN